LDKAGYEAFPAKSVPDALELIADLNLSVGIVILSDSLPGTGNSISTLRRLQKYLKIILLVKDPHQANQYAADAQCIRPRNCNQTSKTEWLQTIQRLLV
jgi:bifunctional ADP-heptose synthase (sugar kinase/adenylyltransferase)